MLAFHQHRNGRESMGNDQRSSVLSQLGKGLLNLDCVRGGSSLIKMMAAGSSGNTRAMKCAFYPTRKSSSTLSYLRVISIWQRFNELGDVYALLPAQCLLQIRAAMCNVLPR